MRKKLGTKIKTLREGRGLSVRALSKELNVRKQTLIRWEKGEVRMRLCYLIKIADFFEVSTDFLLGLKDWFCDVKSFEKQLSCGKIFLWNLTLTLWMTSKRKHSFRLKELFWSLLGLEVERQDCSPTGFVIWLKKASAHITSLQSHSQTKRQTRWKKDFFLWGLSVFGFRLFTQCVWEFCVKT